MATFTNATKRNLTTVDTVYTCSNASGATVIGLSIANVHTGAVTASVVLDGGTNETHLIKDGPIPVGGALVVGGGDQKIVLKNTEAINVSASNNVDVIISVLEI
jgi:hypothetical protein